VLHTVCVCVLYCISIVIGRSLLKVNFIPLYTLSVYIFIYVCLNSSLDNNNELNFILGRYAGVVNTL